MKPPSKPCSSGAACVPSTSPPRPPIRMAEEQVRRLYARDLAVFPAAGAVTAMTPGSRARISKRPGRLYVGYLSPLARSAALSSRRSPRQLLLSRLLWKCSITDTPIADALLDAWWTQVIYHGSLKGVGNSHNAFMTDVRDFGALACQRTVTQGRPAGATGGDDAAEHTRHRLRQVRDMCASLSSQAMRTCSRPIAETFQRLRKRREDGEDPALSTLSWRPTWYPSVWTWRAWR